MLSDAELDKIYGIFYMEAPYDFILVIEPLKQKGYLGACFYEEKVCRIYAPKTYLQALFTLLHEVAHARIQHKTHSDLWAKEFVRLLEKYKFPKRQARIYGILEPNLLQYVNS